MSEREYAAHAGISRGAVQKARTSGRLVLHADGSIDAAASRCTPGAGDRSVDAARPAPTIVASGAGGRRRRGRGDAARAGPAGAAAAGGMTYLQARTANEVLKAQERKMRLQKLRGELVDRARAIALVFRLARQERDAWAGWPARVAAMMAADLGIGAHAMQTVLEKYARQHLGELAEVRPELR